MSSRAILAIHTLIFFLLTTNAVFSIFLLWPDSHECAFLSDEVLIGGFATFSILILASWIVYGGPCPLTVWENRARVREGKPAYRRGCIAHYARRWFKIPLSDNVGTLIALAVLVLPI